MTAIGFVLVTVTFFAINVCEDEIKSDFAKAFCGIGFFVGAALLMTGLTLILWRIAP